MMKVTDEMVTRFLGWKLPEDFHPDAGISFSPYFNVEYNAKQGKPPQRHEPVGTNLFTADQARQMLEHVLGPVSAYVSREAIIRQCIERVKAEHLEDPTELPDDIAYDHAVNDCAEALESLLNERVCESQPSGSSDISNDQ